MGRETKEEFVNDYLDGHPYDRHVNEDAARDTAERIYDERESIRDRHERERSS